MGWKDIPGWTADEMRRAYDKMVESAVDGDAIIEVGVAMGRSLAYVGELIIASKKDIALIAVDPWYYGDAGLYGEDKRSLVEGHGGPYGTFWHLMETYAPEVLMHAQVRREASAEAARWWSGALAHSGLKSDLGRRLHGVMIDADHSYEGCKADIGLWLPLVAPGGWLCGDDYSAIDFPGVVQAVEELDTDIRIGGSPQGVEIDITSWRYRKSPLDGR